MGADAFRPVPRHEAMRGQGARARHRRVTDFPMTALIVAIVVPIRALRCRRDPSRGTSASINARNRSTKSWFVGELAAQAPQLYAQPPGVEHTVGIGQLARVFDVVAVCFRRVRIAPDRDRAFALRRGHRQLSAITALTICRDVALKIVPAIF